LLTQGEGETRTVKEVSSLYSGEGPNQSIGLFSAQYTGRN